MTVETKNTIIVGNIGVVYDGSDSEQARKTFIEYRGQSESDYGRASGESVVWMRDGEIYQEHEGEVKS